MLGKHIDALPLDVVEVRFDESGRIISTSADWKEDKTWVTDHFLVREYQLPSGVATRTVLRSELTEIRRMPGQVDVVSYQAPPRGPPPAGRQDGPLYIFKYDFAMADRLWKEIQVLARLPPHPNFMALDRLVLDETTGSTVVGFTTPYIPGGSLDRTRRPFKLKWLRQLMRAVDDLNLKYGIMHQDIADRNLVIDPDTDSIVLIDFSSAARAAVTEKGGPLQGDIRGADDVKCVALFLYAYITRNRLNTDSGNYLDVDEKDILDPAKWIKHPDVQLDHDVADFYFELMAWLRGRRADERAMRVPEPTEPVVWPNLPGDSIARGYPLGRRKELGLACLEWTRPASVHVDPERRLLATGKYADEETSAEISGDTRTPSAAGAEDNGADAPPARERPGPAKRKLGRDGTGAVDAVNPPAKKRSGTPCRN